MNSTISQTVPRLNGNALYGAKTTSNLGMFRNYQSNSASNQSIDSTSNISKWLCPIELSEGTWIVNYYINYSANANGVRTACIGYWNGSSYSQYAWSLMQMPAGSSGEMAIRTVAAIKTTGTTTIAVGVLQNSGTALTATTVQINARKI